MMPSAVTGVAASPARRLPERRYSQMAQPLEDPFAGGQLPSALLEIAQHPALADATARQPGRYAVCPHPRIAALAQNDVWSVPGFEDT